MNRRRLLVGLLGVAGLALYLWPALTAPVVLWSDSESDILWARSGHGILSPAPLPAVPHPAKPAYLAFLRAAMIGAPEAEAARRIVVVQSILLWLSIAGVSVFLARKTTFRHGLALYVLLLLFLRLRDASSAVMSEALTAAIFLPICAALLVSAPPRWSRSLMLGGAVALLFLVRPNAGGAAVLLALGVFSVSRRWSSMAPFALGFAAILTPVWIMTSPRDDALRGLGANFSIARTEYAWKPAAGLAPASGEEARRQLVWRIFRGPLGLEFYDARWSGAYAVFADWARQMSPLIVLAALAVLLAPSGGGIPRARWLGLALFAFLAAQSFLLGALPRFALPLLPGLFLFAIAAWPPRLPVGAGAILTVLFAVAFWQRHVLDREWGRIESAGVRILQTIPRGALPERLPAVLRLRLAAPLPQSDAHVRILGPDGETLFDSRGDANRSRPYVTVPLTPGLLGANRSGPVSLTLLSHGSYGDTSYLLFPVIPPAWSTEAKREGAAELSPSTGISSGALDWWVADADEPL